jgi:hypothetical protein
MVDLKPPASHSDYTMTGGPAVARDGQLYLSNLTVRRLHQSLAQCHERTWCVPL